MVLVVVAFALVALVGTARYCFAGGVVSRGRRVAELGGRCRGDG